METFQLAPNLSMAIFNDSFIDSTFIEPIMMFLKPMIGNLEIYCPLFELSNYFLSAKAE